MLPEGWSKRAISEIAMVVTGNTPSPADSSNYGGNVPFVTPGDLSDSKYIEATERALTSKGLESARALPAGSVLVTCIGSSIGKVGIPRFRCATNQQINAIVVDGDHDPDFIYYQISKLSPQLNKLAGTQAVPLINKSTFEAQGIYLPPSKREETSIGRVIGIWDEAIATTGLLVANSRHQRRVLLSNVLSGRRRLQRFCSELAQIPTPHGPIPGDWTYPKVESLAHEVSQKHSGGQNYPVLSCTKHSGLVDSLSYFKKQVFSKDLSTYKVVPRGCFVYATNHIEEGSIGYQDLHDYGLVSPMYTVFETDKEVHDGYLYRLLKTEHFRQIFAAATNASVDRRGSLRWNDFKKLHVPLPPMGEQLAIVELLDKADREIGLLEAKLAAFRIEKIALMQQLLTGKRRVHLPEAAEPASP